MIYRTHLNKEIDEKLVGEEVMLAGWVKTIRNLGGLAFIDLRDHGDIVQLFFSDAKAVSNLSPEDVISIKGKVRLREKANPQLKSGKVEVVVTSLTLLSEAKTTPLIIDDATDALEDTRLKYRYLDLRRPIMQHNLKVRAQIVKAVHEYLDAHDFTEIETPLLCLSTPEGARDFLVPSRINKGAFYALPQSPQIFKQLLMIGGLERYYQIAKCLRDEDLRSDRQPEFTQIDIETSFMDEEEILTLTEGLLAKIFQDVAHKKISLPLRRIPYAEAISRYGSDKPDTRFGLEIKALDGLFKDSDFTLFKTVECIRGFIVPNYAHILTRKVLDRLNLEAKKFSPHGLIALKYENGTLLGSITKFLSEEKIEEIIQTLELKNDDVLILGGGDYYKVSFMLGAIRKQLGDELSLYDKNVDDLLWVTEFPLFEKRDDGTFTSSHHPFTRPSEATIQYLKSQPEKVLSSAYDIVINGYEAGGGSLRIYNQDVQKQVFTILGLSEEDIARKFGFFVEAFDYGTPPHGGLAFGLERLTMILCHTDNIRDVIAFPKNLRGVDMMSNAPRPVDPKQLEELGIKID